MFCVEAKIIVVVDGMVLFIMAECPVLVRIKSATA